LGNDNNYGLISTRFYRMAEWIWRFAYVNLLWLGFSLLGLGFLGIFPATVAVYAVVRKWLTGQTEVSIIKLFWSTFKADFLRANILGYLLSAIGFVIWYNYQYLLTATGFEHTIILIFWLVAVVLFVLIVVFLFPVYVHFKMPLFHYFKAAITIALASPLALVSVGIGLWIAFQLFSFIPGLIPFYSVSLTSWLIMWATLQALQRIERKKERIENNEDSIKYRWEKVKEKFSSSND